MLGMIWQKEAIANALPEPEVSNEEPAPPAALPGEMSTCLATKTVVASLGHKWVRRSPKAVVASLPKKVYRELLIPPTLLPHTPGATDMAWADALCCIYTRVALWAEGSAREVGAAPNAARLRLYEGEHEEKVDYTEKSFAEVAMTAYNDICLMESGIVDCEAKLDCVERALAKQDLSALNPPTEEEKQAKQQQSEEMAISSSDEIDFRPSAQANEGDSVQGSFRSVQPAPAARPQLATTQSDTRTTAARGGADTPQMAPRAYMSNEHTVAIGAGAAFALLALLLLANFVWKKIRGKGGSQPQTLTVEKAARAESLEEGRIKVAPTRMRSASGVMSN